MTEMLRSDSVGTTPKSSEQTGKGTRNWKRSALIPVGIVVAFFLPQLLGGSEVIYQTLVLVAIFSVMAYGADFILSYLGEVSLGHTLFWASGAYVTALVTTERGWGPFAALAAAIVVAAVLAFLVGLFTLRTQAFVFSLVTYGSALIALTIVSNVAWLGGSDGVVGIPILELPAIGGTYQAGTAIEIWPIAFALLALVVYFVSRFRRSTLGTRALMVQSNTDLARAIGVDPGSVRLLVFTISAPVSAAAGWLYAYQRAYVSPDLFDPYFLLLMLTAVILAGRRQLLGPIVGTAIIIFQQQMFSMGTHGDDIVLGVILGGVLLVWPQGLGGLVDSLRPFVTKASGRDARNSPRETAAAKTD